MKNIALFFIVILLSSCNRYLVTSIDTKLGIKLSQENLKICKGINTRKFNGKPVGKYWIRSNEVQGIQLTTNDLFKPIINESIFQILKDDKQKEFCHGVDIYDSDLNARKSDEKILKLDYIVEFPNQISLSEIFSQTIITKALESLEIDASTNNVSLPASFISKFKNEMKKELNTSSTSSAKLRYIIIDVQGIDLNSNETSLPIQEMKKLNLDAPLEKYKNGYNIIMGISGFSITNFSSQTKIVQDNSMITAIELAIKGESPELQKFIEKIKISASLNWSKQVNENIQTEINVNGCNFFYPLWIKPMNKNKNAL
jgi:hypothetical protein